MDDRLTKYCRMKIKTHMTAIGHIREIQQDVIAGKMSLQEAKLAITDEEECCKHQLKVFQEFYELTAENLEVLNG